MLKPFKNSPLPLARLPSLTQLDAEALGRLTALDPSGENRLLERVLNAFQGSAVRLVPQLEAGRAGADWNAVRLVAHTLKSSSASIGALALAALCARVETAIRTDAIAGLDADILAMTRELDLALQAIERLLMERGA
jgi:HPt (histidine-containing phosphotransfer) domain-containing protein